MPKHAAVERNKHRRPTLERCLSAPMVGGDPASLSSHLATEEPRVYPGDGHKVERKLTGCQKPDGLVESSRAGPDIENNSQSTVPATDGYMQHVPAAMDQAQSPTSNGDRRRNSTTQHRTALPVNTHPPAPVVSGQPYYVQGPQAPQGPLPYGAFANQIPVYALPRHSIGGIPPAGPPPPFPPPPQMPTYNRGYPVNSTPTRPPKEAREPFFAQQNINPRAQDFHQGKWQHVGTNTIHGPKVVFQKESFHSQTSQGYPVSQGLQSYQAGQGGFDGIERRQSNASSNRSYQRFGNTPRQEYSNPTSRPRLDSRATLSWRNPEASASSKQSPYEHGCVNRGKRPNVATKFDPCLCNSCQDKDRCIYVGRFTVELSQAVLDMVAQNFKKFGEVCSVERVNSVPAVFVR